MSLLRHARDTTDFYAPQRSIELADFPVVSKSDLKIEFERFLSHIYTRDELIKVTTSGSYGTPFSFLLSQEKKTRQSAEAIFFGRWSGYDIGMRHAYLVAKSKSPLKLFAQNEILMDPSALTDGWLNEQRKHLRTGEVRVIIGYPSGIGALSAYCRSKGDKPDDFRLRGVITTAEPLLPEVRKMIRGAFGCPVVSRYSTEEFGVLANERPDLEMHCVNAASYHVEILRLDSNETAKPGETGRVVVTDLFSQALPLIRYDTGDLAVSSDEQSKRLGVPVLERLEGRVVEEITGADGRRVSPFAINGAMRDVENVLQFQFVQRGDDHYTLKLVIQPGFDSENRIRERFDHILGRDANLKIERVDEIAPLPSGKRPYILSRDGSGRSGSAD